MHHDVIRKLGCTVEELQVMNKELVSQLDEKDEKLHEAMEELSVLKNQYSDVEIHFHKPTKGSKKGSWNN